MLSSEKPLKRLIFRWTALKGLTAIILFVVLALIIEYIIIYLFMSSGLTDDFLISQAFQIPGTAFSFTITISPIFHLMPLGVIIVMVSSWTYLTKYIAVVPQKVSTPRKTQEARRQRYARPGKARFKSIRQALKKLNRRIRGVTRRVSTAVRRIRGVSYVLQRLSFAEATIKSAATIVAIFLVSVFALSILTYPSLIHDRITGLYGANPSFHGFVLETLEAARAIGQTLSPIGWILSGLDNALHSAAPSFRNALEGFGASISEPLARLDIEWKYAVCQNVAAWISAIAALVYGQYASHVYRRYRR